MMNSDLDAAGYSVSAIQQVMKPLRYNPPWVPAHNHQNDGVSDDRYMDALRCDSMERDLTTIVMRLVCKMGFSS
jgi:hypothetical protein